MAVVILQRKVLQMMVRLCPQIVGNQLTDTRREVCGEEIGNRSHGGDHHDHYRRHRRDPYLVVVTVRGFQMTGILAQKPVQPVRGRDDGPDVVDNELERPRDEQGHARLHQHRRQDDDKDPAVRFDQLSNQAEHGNTPSLRADGKPGYPERGPMEAL